MNKQHRNLTKAAILVASLDADNAESLLAQMSPGQVQAVRDEIERLGPIDSFEQREVLEEFFRIGPLVPRKQPAGIELDGRLPRHLALSSDDREMALAGQRVVHSGPPFKFLHEASARALSPILEREHPTTIAVVVSHLPADRAAEILAALPAELQIDVARRLVDLDEIDPEILRDVECGLETWLCEEVRTSQRRTAGMTALTNILEAANPQARQRLMANLAPHDDRWRASEETITAPLLTLSFDDVQQLDRASLSIVLNHAERDLLLLALRGAHGAFVGRVLGMLPAATARSVQQNLSELGAVRLSDVETAQRALAELASDLERCGQIVPRARGSISVAV